MRKKSAIQRTHPTYPPEYRLQTLKHARTGHKPEYLSYECEPTAATICNKVTMPFICRILEKTLKIPFVSTSAESDQLHLQNSNDALKAITEWIKKEYLEALDNHIKPVFQKITIHYKGKRETYYSYCNTHHIHNVSIYRLVFNYHQADLSDILTFTISNHMNWHVPGITPFAAIAGLLKYITRNAKPKDWISISYGALVPFNAMSFRSLSSKVKCVPPNMTLSFKKSFIFNSSPNLKVTWFSGGELLKLKFCGGWPCSSAYSIPRAVLTANNGSLDPCHLLFLTIPANRRLLPLLL